MSLRTDCRGLEITAAGQAAVDGFDRAVSSYLGLRLDPGDHLKAAMDADPDLLLGHVLRGYFMLLFANRKLLSRAGASLEAAGDSAVRNGANSREKRHIEALAAWLSGDQIGARTLWDAILIEWPRDVVALKLSEYWNFYLGDSAGMREVQTRVAPHWDESVPDYGKVLGMQAFALEECGAYDEAERRGRRAVEIDPEDLWSTHAVAHVLETTGRHRDGIAWVDDAAPNFGACNAVVNHLWWHRALYYFELGQFDAVLELYDREIVPKEPFEYLDLCNAVSLLWRLGEESVRVGDRWDFVADAVAHRVEDFQLVFADVHYAMALAAAGRTEALDMFVGAAEEFARTEGNTQAEVMKAHGIALCKAADVAMVEDPDAVVGLIYPRRRRIHAIGGSHAQRDLFQRMLIHAAEKARRGRLAASLLAERCAQRPTSPIALGRYARVLAVLGETEGAQAAAKSAARLAAS